MILIGGTACGTSPGPALVTTAICVCIYIYIYRERERDTYIYIERERDLHTFIYTVMFHTKNCQTNNICQIYEITALRN